MVFLTYASNSISTYVYMRNQRNVIVSHCRPGAVFRLVATRQDEPSQVPHACGERVARAIGARFVATSYESPSTITDLFIQSARAALQGEDDVEEGFGMLSVCNVCIIM